MTALPGGAIPFPSLSSGPAVSSNGDAGGGIDTGQHVFNFGGSSSGLGGSTPLILGGIGLLGLLLWNLKR